MWWSGGVSTTKSQHSWRGLLSQAAVAVCDQDVTLFSALVTQNTAVVQHAYDDFFFIAARANISPAFMEALLKLDPTCNNPRMARVHIRFLMNTPAQSQQVVSLICQHYSRVGMLQHILNQYGSAEYVQDSQFRPNMHNILILPMRRTVHDNINEDFTIEILKVFLNNGIQINARYKLDGGQSALHYAAYNNLWKCVELLLKYGGDLDMSYKCSSAREIIENRKMGHLITDKAPSILSNDVTVPLFSALYNRDEEKFRNIYLATLTNHSQYSEDDWSLICQHAPLSFISECTGNTNLTFNQDDGWCTLLQLACIKNLPEAVRTILEIDPDPDRISTLQDPALLLAAERGCWEVVSLLVSHDCDEKGGVKRSAVDVAVKGDFGDSLLHKIAKTWADKNLEGEEARKASFILVNIFETLEKRGELDVNYVNKKSETPLMYAIKSSNKFLFNLLLKKGAFLGVSKDLLRDIRSEDLINMFNASLSTEDYKGRKFVNIDFECLYLQYEIPNIPDFDIYPEMLPLYKLSRSKNHQEVLSNPLITSFLDLKWLKFCWMYLLNLFFYLCFVVSLTYHVYVMHEPEQASLSFTLTTIFWSYLLAREILQLTMSYSEYFGTLENWLELFILVGTMVMLTYNHTELATLIVLATYAEFSLLLGRHPEAATYIAMFLRVSRVNALLLALSSPVIFAFATCFSILLRDENPHFQNASLSSFKTLVMLAGEFEFGDLQFEASPILGRAIFILFVVAITVILMNLLNALAVSDTEAIRRDAEIISLQAKIELFTKIESALLGYPMDWYLNQWGPFPNSTFWYYVFKLRNKFKKFLTDGCVLPLSDHNKFILSVREDGKVMDRSIGENGKIIMKKNYALNINPKSRILKLVTKYILGVNMRRIFEFSYYFTVFMEHSEDDKKLYSQVQEVKQELCKLKDDGRGNTVSLKGLQTSQILLSQRMSELLESTEAQNQKFDEIRRSLSTVNSTVHNQISELNQQIRILSEIMKVRTRSDEAGFKS